MIRIVVVLPAPLEPRKPQLSPGANVEADAVQRLDRAEPLPQAIDDEQSRDLPAWPPWSGGDRLELRRAVAGHGGVQLLLLGQVQPEDRVQTVQHAPQVGPVL